MPSYVGGSGFSLAKIEEMLAYTNQHWSEQALADARASVPDFGIWYMEQNAGAARGDEMPMAEARHMYDRMYSKYGRPSVEAMMAHQTVIAIQHLLETAGFPPAQFEVQLDRFPPLIRDAIRKRRGMGEHAPFAWEQVRDAAQVALSNPDFYNNLVATNSPFAKAVIAEANNNRTTQLAHQGKYSAEYLAWVQLPQNRGKSYYQWEQENQGKIIDRRDPVAVVVVNQAADTSTGYAAPSAIVRASGVQAAAAATTPVVMQATDIGLGRNPMLDTILTTASMTGDPEFDSFLAETGLTPEEGVTLLEALAQLDEGELNALLIELGG